MNSSAWEPDLVQSGRPQEAPSPQVVLTSVEVTVLRELVCQDIGWCLNFHGLEEYTGLERGAIREACRSLAAKGLAVFRRGLFNDTGELAGSGYGATGEGRRFSLPPDDRRAFRGDRITPAGSQDDPKSQEAVPGRKSQ